MTFLRRSVALSLCLIGCSVLIAQASTSHAVPLRQPLAQFPLQLDHWSGSEAAELGPNVIEQLHVTDYLNRVYQPDAAGMPVGLYVGYYDSQSQGETMHSPLNCLPGSGWQPISSGRLKIPLNQGDIGPNGSPLAESSSLEVNRYLVQKGGDYLLVLYWYQSHGRVVASDYWGKFYTVVDALRLHRTDAALVRVIIPVPVPTAAPTARAEAQSEAMGSEFVRLMFPQLVRYLPV